MSTRFISATGSLASKYLVAGIKMSFVFSDDSVDKCVSRTLIYYLTIKQAFISEFSMYISPSASYIIFYVNFLCPLTRIQPLILHF